MRVTEWIRDDIAGRKSLTPDRFYGRESQEKTPLPRLEFF